MSQETVVIVDTIHSLRQAKVQTLQKEHTVSDLKK